MENFLNYFRNITHLSPESENALKEVSKFYTFPKGYLLHKPGEIAKTFYYVTKGIGKLYYYKGRKEIVDWIGDENTILFSPESFLTQKPGYNTIELLEDSELIGIDYEDIEKLYRKFHDIERLGRLHVTYGLLLLQEKVNSMQFETAKQRYDKLIKEHPNYLERVSLKDLASFLGMTQVSLSRIRAVNKNPKS
ncbi:Crp/Fnr family transcriptional regulator [Leptospira semungkisensis]|uniref:Crp/Fnr family transcriptional regulator n=1 Tax=Leptospira semungkisensis TaxID=2484985 RepID=A0A4R9FQI0_9LEPT|nr:Crp/Fnr family transcriptional regulator [Leptospira semungkisensis]TGK01052.1 Crp/Fnr family transcriptional regulator [Leptospira semungkisensis]